MVEGRIIDFVLTVEALFNVAATDFTFDFGYRDLFTVLDPDFRKESAFRF